LWIPLLAQHILLIHKTSQSLLLHQQYRYITMSMSTATVGLTAPELPSGNLYRAVCAVVPAKTATMVDLRSAADIVKMFAPFESVKLVSAEATITLANGPATRVSIAWVGNTTTASLNGILNAYDSLSVYSQTYGGTHAILPLSSGHPFGTELKTLVTGNPSPALCVHAESSGDMAPAVVRIRITFSASGVAVV
jgi:hypothetical protein